MSHTIRKYPAKPKLRDQRQFVLHLCARLVQQMPLRRRAVPLAHALLHALGQKAVHRLALRHRVMRKFVAQIGERELQPLAHNARVGNRLGNVAEQCRHLARRAQMPCIVHASSRPAWSSVV